MEHRHVVVIGGGVIGAAAAYYLAQAGVEVVLLERNDLASGTSGACNGFVWLATKKDGFHLRLARASLGLLKTFIASTRQRVDCSAAGELLLIESDEQLEDAREFVDRRRTAGIDVELLTRVQTEAMQPALAGSPVVGAVYGPDGVVANPLDLVFAFAADAASMGAEVRCQTTVEHITVSRGRVRSVHTNRGDIAADYVVNAAGVAAGAMAQTVGMELPITPLRGQVMVTESIDPLIRIPSLEFGYLAVKRNPELLRQTTRAGVTCSVSQGSSGNIYLGSSKESVGFNIGVSLEATREIARKAAKFYPALADVRIIRCYAGLRPFTPDWLPIIGPVPGIDGLIMAAGHGGDGIALAAVTGRLVADLITTSEPFMRIDELSVSRFSDAASIG